MRNQLLAGLAMLSLCGTTALAQNFGGPREGISREAERLVVDSEMLASDAYNFFAGYNGVIQNSEQQVLFKAEAFASASRLFTRLSKDSSWSSESNIRTNINAAFDLLKGSFDELENIVSSTEEEHQWRRRGNNRPL